MALKVEECPAGDIPDRLPLDRPQGVAAVEEAGDVVEVAGLVNGRDFVPPLAIDRMILVHVHHRNVPPSVRTTRVTGDSPCRVRRRNRVRGRRGRPVRAGGRGRRCGWPA